MKFGLKWFFIVPVVLTLLTGLIIGLSNWSKHISWYQSIVGWSAGVLIFSCIGSVILFFVLENSGVGERRFNSRERCDLLIVDEMERSGVKIRNWTSMSNSGAGVGWYGKLKDKKIYSKIVVSKLGAPKYFMVGIDMEEGHEDDRRFRLMPQNFSDDKIDLVESVRVQLCEELAGNLGRDAISENVVTDPFTGHQVTSRSRTPYAPVKQDLDVDGEPN